MATATKSAKKPHSASVKRSDRFFKPTQAASFFPAAQRKAPRAPVVQTSLAVSKPADPLEREADRTAETVMRMPAEQAQRTSADEVQRAPIDQVNTTPADQVQSAPAGQVQTTASEQVQRFGAGTPPATHVTESQIRGAATGGETLNSDVRSFMEPRLGADFSSVRVHADDGAARLSSQISARAFTYGNHVFFGRDQYQPGSDDGRRLLAHELTHTVQQGASVRRAPAAEGPAQGPAVQRAEDRPPKTPVVQRTAEKAPETPAVQKAASPRITTTGAPPPVQRLGIQDALDYFADKAHNIMGFRMLTLVIGFNPINRRTVPRTAANFLRALIEMLPGGNFITRALDNHGVINKAAGWVEKKVAALGDIGTSIVEGLRRFLDSLRWRDIVRLGSVWDRAKRIFTDPIAHLVSFGKGVVVDLLTLVKEAILRPLAALAEGTPAYDLLKAVLGRNPITGDPVPRNADTLIGGFMKMIGQEEVWLNIKRGNAVPRAFAWFQGALAGLLGFVLSIPAKVLLTLRSLTFEDVITVVGAFRKIGGAFLGVAIRFSSWAFGQVVKLLEILFSVVAPGVLPYIAKAKGAFQTILRDPVGFVRNLVAAGKLGFQLFARNILGHLKTALIKWLVGPLADAGVYIPKSFSLLEIVKLVLSVLGLTWKNIRGKLLKIIPEPILEALEKTASVLVTLVRDGPAAAWEQIKDELIELKDNLIGQFTQMVQSEVVKAAVGKLVSMLNPAGAVIQAIIAIYRTVTFFIQRARQIGAVVASFIDSIAAIAAGRIVPAAKRVESTLARALVVVLGFLANFAGLGGIPAKLVAIVGKVRAPIDTALDKIVAWLGRVLDALVAKMKAAASDSRSEGIREQARARLLALTKDAKDMNDVHAAMSTVRSQMVPHGLKSLELRPTGEEGDYDVMVAASDATKKAKVHDQFARATRKADVAARATITYHETPDVSSLSFGREALKEDGKVVFGPDGEPVLIPSGAPSASAAGMLVMPPRPGRKTLDVLGLSGKTLRKAGSNASHAENHLTNFITDTQTRTFVVGVEIRLSGKWTPCSQCAGTLARLASWVREQAGDRQVTLTLDCGTTQLHGDWKDDGNALLEALADWEVSGRFVNDLAKVVVK